MRSAKTRRGAETPRTRGLSAVALGLTPTLLAVWFAPAFVTQDGPAHLYNAHILIQSLVGDDSALLARTYEAHWRPLPNWGGHLLLMGLVGTLPAQAADRLMTTLTLIGPALALVWLRTRVVGTEDLTRIAPLVALVAINVAWLFGFASFLVGLVLLLVTWGLWWSWRDRLSPRRVVLLGGLLAVGYLGHLISLGLTMIGLFVLAVALPGPGRRARLIRTATACGLVLPLLALYQTIASGSGGFEPRWEYLEQSLSPLVWIRRAAWVDPITLGRRDIAPGLEQASTGFILLVPSLWLGAALLIWLINTLRATVGNADATTAWLWLAGVLLIGALVSPDGLGGEHGYYLSQRIALVGLCALVPALKVSTRGTGKTTTVLVWIAVASQSAFVWDYAAESSRRAGAMLAAKPAVGRSQRIATLLIDPKGRYRANPLLHADCLLGVGADNVIWSNYETRHYYFPVSIRDDLQAPASVEFERVARLAGPNEGAERAKRWEHLISENIKLFDVLVIWGSDPELEAVHARWFGGRPVYERGRLRIFRRTASEAAQRRGNSRDEDPPPDAGK